MNTKKYNLLPFLLGLLILVSSCGVSKKVTYFRDIPDSLKSSIVVNHTDFEEPKIKEGDMLNISIQTLNPHSVEMISGSTTTNAPVATNTVGGTSSGGNMNVTGYLVDKNGFVEMPLVGRIKVAGLTLDQAHDIIYDSANRYYNNPIVNVRANFVISVLGDVARPGTYTVPNNKVSVLDAISVAGDLNITGKRNNILLLRESENNQVMACRLDINSTNFFRSPYYYLRSGDKIYVEPNKARKRAATIDITQDRYITYTVSLLTLLLAFSTRF